MRTVDLPVDGDWQLAFPADDHIASGVAKDGCWYEVELLDAIHKHCGDGGSYIDVGAHVGNHSAYFLRRCHADFVVAYEPHPDLFLILCQNLFRFRRLHWRAYRYAVGDEYHWTWYRDPADGNTGTGRLVSKESWRHGDRRVDVVPLSHQWVHADLRCIKIDAEGGAVDVVAGAVRHILRQKPLIAVECDDPTPIIDLLPGYAVVGEYCKTPTYLLSHG